MPIVKCSKDYCIYRGEGGTCEAEAIELVTLLGGSVYLLCLQANYR
jgi:hypothetical protein